MPTVNIEKVYENGELAIRYQYDALNRLIREDNKTLDKTYVFVYDFNVTLVNQGSVVQAIPDFTCCKQVIKGVIY